MKKELTLYWEGKVSYGFSYWVWLTLIGGIISIPTFLSDAYYDAYLIPMVLYLAF